ncbi:HIT domain-containing protein [Patescibacteria group bacterium]
MSSGKKVADASFAKGDEYAQVIKEIIERGECPFCPAGFIYHKYPILKKNGEWFITRSSWPYENAEHHFIILSDRHMECVSEITPEDLVAVQYLASWAVDEFDLKGGALNVRFGDTEYTGATVCHIHFHLIVPKYKQTVIFPIG